MKNYELDLIMSAAQNPNSEIDLSPFYKTAIGELLNKMEATEQNPVYHAEGTVLNHTKRVLSELLHSEEYKDESDEGRYILFLACLLHDIGKIDCTRIENGEITSPRHTIVGAKLARKTLWQMGLAGDSDSIRIREAVCQLIRYHSYPPFCINDKDDVRLHRIAENGSLTDAFSLRRLLTLEKADVLGRIGEGVADMFDRVKYCEMMAKELQILDTPYRFMSDFTKRAYYKRRLNWRGGGLYQPEPFEVILMAGLPGTGKDTYIKNNFPDLPVVSLDAIRERLSISPTQNQSKVVECAREEEKALLRKKIPFVWNATSITNELRSMQISLFEEYGASVRCIYLETEWKENLRRNRERKRVVPETVIERMLSRLEVPEAYECERVEWIAI